MVHNARIEDIKTIVLGIGLNTKIVFAACVKWHGSETAMGRKRYRPMLVSIVFDSFFISHSPNEVVKRARDSEIRLTQNVFKAKLN